MSSEATILDFTFEAEVVADDRVAARRSIVRQLLYTQGALRTASKASGQVGNVKLSSVTESALGDKKRIAYRASMPVAWPKGAPSPAQYELVLPRDATALTAFNRKYDGYCGKSQYGPDNFWHDFDPRGKSCALDPADVTRASVTVAPHAESAVEKYPEYHRIWEDGRLDVVAIFGVIESNDTSDWGYTEAGRFADAVARQLTKPSAVRRRTSRSIFDDTTVSGKATVGGMELDVEVDVLVVGMLAQAGPDFDARYEPLSAKADMILYNGHAQLGANTNALSRKGRIVRDKYQLVLLNGCESFALVDTTMNDRRREVNGASDPKGTRFLDVVSNARPGYANNLATISNTLFSAALRADTPRHYRDLITTMPESHVVVVWGEEDNGFTPP